MEPPRKEVKKYIHTSPSPQSSYQDLGLYKNVQEYSLFSVFHYKVLICEETMSAQAALEMSAANRHVFHHQVHLLEKHQQHSEYDQKWSL